MGLRGKEASRSRSLGPSPFSAPAGQKDPSLERLVWSAPARAPPILMPVVILIFPPSGNFYLPLSRLLVSCSVPAGQ